MRFTVIWHPDVRNELAEIWLNSRDRRAISRAANEIDRRLAAHPESSGEEFYGDRILVVAPLAVTFSVSASDLRVVVLQVTHREP